MLNIFTAIIDFVTDLPPKRRFVLLLLSILFITFTVLFFVFEKPILTAPFAQQVRELQYGYLMLTSLIIVTCFPPLPGYSSLIMLSGFIYGFPLGFAPALCGALIGSMTCFGLFRSMCKNYTDKLVGQDRRFAALAVAIHHEGFKIIFLIRLSPFPITYSNAFFASIRSVSLWKFTLATILTMPKLLIHVFIGSRLANLTNELDSTSRLINYLSIGIGLILFFIATWWLYNKTMEAARNAAGKGRMVEKSEIETVSGSSDKESSEYFLEDDLAVIEDSGYYGGTSGVGTSKSASKHWPQQEISMYQIVK
ncbi:8502_t:CDS:2 [Ambispora gerdemannii]|uniref:Golgi apparatus membrane protein TVP38 n=1 Tax=Ambispora gerdemannii TaxID=144530 RepID=A0A9N9BFM3_9GLOM|nr:8502_t:CDS:2 [Ambispora gerdemannii]